MKRYSILPVNVDPQFKGLLLVIHEWNSLYPIFIAQTERGDREGRREHKTPYYSTGNRTVLRPELIIAAYLIFLNVRLKMKSQRRKYKVTTWAASLVPSRPTTWREQSPVVMSGRTKTTSAEGGLRPGLYYGREHRKQFGRNGKGKFGGNEKTAPSIVLGAFSCSHSQSATISMLVSCSTVNSWLKMATVTLYYYIIKL